MPYSSNCQASHDPLHDILLEAIRTGVRLQVERGDCRGIVPSEQRVMLLHNLGMIKGICELLISKGVFNPDELSSSILEGLREVVRMQEKYLADCGRPVKLLP